jgi:hypothetical protein
MKNKKLAEIFSISYPNTLDTTGRILFFFLKKRIKFIEQKNK